ncbi:MAG: N-6 DNA methylase [Aquificae bacterium]|nr:N-6 DNA methylase [Aquificota bacterium]
MENLHERWLSFVERNGIFVSEVVLKKYFSNKLEKIDKYKLSKLKKEYERFSVGNAEKRIQREWFNFIFEDFLNIPTENWIKTRQFLKNYAVEIPDFLQTLEPDRLLVIDKKPKLAVFTVSPQQDIDKNEKKAGKWKASPYIKLERYLRDSGIPFGIVTNGFDFRIVFAEKGFTTSYITFREGWVDDELLTNAFFTILNKNRWFWKPSLEDLVKESREKQTEITDQLGIQVKEAVELFISYLDKKNKEHNLEIFKNLTEKEIYEMALFYMMRIIFILFAEENYLLPHENPIYEKNYGIGSLLSMLSNQKRNYPDSLKHTYDAWFRILALFRLIYEGSEHPDLNLKAYGGELFDYKKFPVLEDKRLKLSNKEIYEILHKLTYAKVKFGKEYINQKVSYSTLDIEHIGQMYEGLLAYSVKKANTPIYKVKRENNIIYVDEKNLHTEDEILEKLETGSFYLTFSGERKTTGTYYTPKSLTLELVKRTLEPLVKNKKTPEEILSLKICDPSMGSGAFLVAACNFLAEKLVDAWQKRIEEYPNETLVLPYALPSKNKRNEEPLKKEYEEMLIQAKRLITERCLYGVDINPLAVELGKLSLWLNSFSKDRPFTFLDAHLKVGNSLVGASFSEKKKIKFGKNIKEFPLIGFIPNEVFKDRKLKDENKRYLKDLTAGQLDFVNFNHIKNKFKSLIVEREKFEKIPTSTPKDYERKEKALKELNESENFKILKEIGDLWCSVWFWEDDNLKPTTREYLEILHYLLGNRKINFYLTEEKINQIINKAEKIAKEYKFFHWELEFPEVFLREEQGFDLILGNPPWEKIKIQDKEFFASKDEEIANASTSAKRKQLIKKLKETNPKLYNDYQKALFNAESLGNFLRKSGFYPLTAKGDINTYSIFAERVRNLLGKNGYAGIIVPTGIATDNTNKEFFQDLIEKEELAFLFDFENREKLFVHVDSRMKFSLLSLTKAQNSRPKFAFYLTNINQLYDENRIFILTKEDFYLLNPNTKTCPIFRTKKDAEITKKIYRVSPIFVKEDDPNGNPWGVRFLSMFHMSNDSHLFKTKEELEREGYVLDKFGNFIKGSERYLRLYEAKMIHQFDHRYATYEGVSEKDIKNGNTRELTIEEKNQGKVVIPRYWVKEEEVIRKIRNSPTFIIGVREITNATNERTVLATILPFSSVGGTIISIFIKNQSLEFISNINSFVLDYISRQKIGGTHLTIFGFKQLPVLPPETYEKELLNTYFENPEIKTVGELIKEKALELVYTAEDLRPFAEEMGYFGEPFKFDPERRAILRAELDAIFAHLYGVSKEEFDYILDTFPIVKRHDEEKYGEYKTKRLCLEYYDRYKNLIPKPKNIIDI